MSTKPQFPPIIATNIASGLRWSEEARNRAAEKHSFIRVTEVPSKPLAYRHLSGAARKWTSDDPNENSSIFHLGTRITGTPTAVVAALRGAKMSDAEIQKVLDNSITANNYQTTMAAAYQNEIAAHKRAREAADKPIGYNLDAINWFSDNIQLATVAKKSGYQKSTATATARPASSIGEMLVQKIKALREGKVLDVSGLNLLSGKGTRSAPKPGQQSRSGKFGSDRLKMVSNDLEKYRRAVEFIYGEQGLRDYADDIKYVSERLGLEGPVVAQQPVMVAGATLAPAPLFRQAPSVRTPTSIVSMGGARFPAMPSLRQQQ